MCNFSGPSHTRCAALKQHLTLTEWQMAGDTKVHEEMFVPLALCTLFRLRNVTYIKSRSETEIRKGHWK